MGDRNYFTGEVTVTPPLTAREIRSLPLLCDVGLRISRASTLTDDGESVIVTAPAIKRPAEWGGGHIAEDLQALADEFGADHAFAGFIEMWPDPGYGPTSPKRFLIRDGRAVVVDAQIVWPGEAGA